MGSGGDELYGVEPTSYYIKNLFLTLGPSWVLLPLSPLGVYCMLRFVWSRAENYGWTSKSAADDANTCVVVIWSSALLWLGVLFSRPHKEDRFMYPVYPLVLLIGAITVHGLVQAALYYALEKAPVVRGAVTTYEISATNTVFKTRISWLVYGLFIAVSGVCGISRCASNYNNYHGYISLWEGFQDRMMSTYYVNREERSEAVGIQAHSRVSSTVSKIANSHSQLASMKYINRYVCMGGDWYTFPSHYFMPKDIVSSNTTTIKTKAGTALNIQTSITSEAYTNQFRLAYIRDNFHGLLPQYFVPNADRNGTFTDPLLRFNNMNREEPDRYLDITDCDYVITTLHAEYLAYVHNKLPIPEALVTKMAPVEKFLLVDQHSASHKSANFEAVISEKVINSGLSPALTRAYYVPTLTPSRNTYNQYTLFEKL